MHRKFEINVTVVSETDRQTDALIAVLRSPTGDGEVNTEDDVVEKRKRVTSK